MFLIHPTQFLFQISGKQSLTKSRRSKQTPQVLAANDIDGLDAKTRIIEICELSNLNLYFMIDCDKNLGQKIELTGSDGSMKLWDYKKDENKSIDNGI